MLLSVCLFVWQVSVCVRGRLWKAGGVSTGTDQVRHQSQRSTSPPQLPNLRTGQTTRAPGHGKLIENNRPTQSFFFFLTPNDRSMKQFPSQLFHFIEGGEEDIQGSGVMFINCPVTSWKPFKFNMAKSKTMRIWAPRITLQQQCNALQ